MSALDQAVDDYLALRRGLGFKLEMHGRVLPQFAEFLEQRAGDGDHAPRWRSSSRPSRRAAASCGGISGSRSWPGSPATCRAQTRVTRSRRSTFCQRSSAARSRICIPRAEIEALMRGRAQDRARR